MTATERVNNAVNTEHGEHLTDLGNARRLVARHGDDLRFVQGLGWLCWDGARWRRDVTGAVERRAKDTVAALYAEAADASDETQRKAVAKWAIATEAEPRIRAMVNLARSELGVALEAEALDSDVYLLNVASATIDLRTGTLRPHRRDDLITKLSPVAYDPDAPCPTWESFLARVLPDPEVLAFVQRSLGYSLIGNTTEQILLFLHGGGANGKSTFLTTSMSVLGDYARQADPELLLARRGEAHPTNVAALRGARMVTCTEVGEGRRLAEVLVKQLTGGDRLTARHMRQDFFEFEATFTVWLGANHRPVVKGTDLAMWRRIRLVPFTVTIPDGEQDHHLGDKLADEAPGILAWAVRGCLDWQTNGLRPPGPVMAATEAYRAEQDVLREFLEDRCITTPAETVSAKDIFDAYKSWCDEAGERPMTQKAFGTRLADRGFERGQHGASRERRYLSVGLRTHRGGEHV